MPFAIEHRLDLARVRWEVEQADRQLAFEHTPLFFRVGIGAGYEGDLGRASSKGPVVSLGLPLFDQNQAQIARAQYRLRQSRKQLAARGMRARQEVTETLAEIDFRHQQIKGLREGLDPVLQHAPAVSMS